MARKTTVEDLLARVERLRAIIREGSPLTEKEVRLVKAELGILLHDLDAHLKRLKYPT